MNQREILDAEIHLSPEKLRSLESELQLLRTQLEKMLELFEEHQVEITAQQSSIARLDQTIHALLSGRTWRMISMPGRIARKFLVPDLKKTLRNVQEQMPSKNCYLVCDEPAPKDPRVRSGSIVVSGWCLAEGGVDCVQVEVTGLPVIETTPGLPRPDVKLALPDLDKTGRAGFSTEFDSTPLANGRHTISVRLISKGNVVLKRKTFVRIDHSKGYANDYQRWIAEFERGQEQFIDIKLHTLKYRPLISVIVPAFNTNPADLTAAIESVRAQSYPNWELCIADDGSSNPETRGVIEKFAAEDNRIKTVFRRQSGGISAASNSALELAEGEYIGFLDHDDTLSPHALAWVAEALNRNPDIDLAYSDEDKLDVRGRRYEPFFKPDWSPDLLRSTNYICHFLVLRKKLLDQIGGFRSEFDGSQDYDLILRATEQASVIEHIPKVLYHWRAIPGSTAASLENKSYAIDAAKRALEKHCERTAPGATVEPEPIRGWWHVRYPIPQATRVSIIIPSGGKEGALRTNLDSLFAKTTYRDYEVVVSDNSKGKAIEELVRSYTDAGKPVRYIDWRNQPFNFSAINNAAAKQCESPVLLFLNDDTSVIEPAWLEAMTELAMRPEVGAVGAKLLYPDGRIQHAGVVMGMYDNCGHAFTGLDGRVPHYFGFSDIIRNVSGVTGACLMARSEVFWRAGGFDEGTFAIAFNDVDLCLKIAALGYRVLFTPHALLTHFESLSKSSRDLVPDSDEVLSMRTKWGAAIQSDPYYSPNLTRNKADYSPRTREA
ncbi:MAG TPA: glycosyltransferase family 2 protein [Bryobacteraceae bacterium]